MGNRSCLVANAGWPHRRRARTGGASKVKSHSRSIRRARLPNNKKLCTPGFAAIAVRSLSQYQRRVPLPPFIELCAMSGHLGSPESICGRHSPAQTPLPHGQSAVPYVQSRPSAIEFEMAYQAASRLTESSSQSSTRNSSPGPATRCARLACNCSTHLNALKGWTAAFRTGLD